MHDWIKRQTGCHKRLRCCQDSIHKTKSQAGRVPGVKTRDTLGMDRYPCNGHLDILIIPLPVDHQMWEAPCHTIRITLQHAIQHKTYEDISMPEAALGLIRDYVFSPPSLITAELQKYWPSISSKQVHDAWSHLTADLWKLDENQITSARKLLEKLGDQVDTWDLDVPEGVVAIGWGMRGIAGKLKDRIVEIALDATCECIVLDVSSLLTCS